MMCHATHRSYACDKIGLYFGKFEIVKMIDLILHFYPFNSLDFSQIHQNLSDLYSLHHKKRWNYGWIFFNLSKDVFSKHGANLIF